MTKLMKKLGFNRSWFNRKGMGSLEALVAVGIMGGAVYAIVSSWGTVTKLQTSSSTRFTAAKLKNTMLTALQSSSGWTRTLANNAAMNDPTQCAAGCTFTLYHSDASGGGVYYDGTVGTRGFTFDGLDCNAFNVAGNYACPFRFDLRWKPVPVCGGGPCPITDIEVTATLQYSPGTAVDRTVLNTAAHSIRLIKPGTQYIAGGAIEAIPKWDTATTASQSLGMDYNSSAANTVGLHQAVGGPSSANAFLYTTGTNGASHVGGFGDSGGNQGGVSIGGISGGVGGGAGSIQSYNPGAAGAPVLLIQSSMPGRVSFGNPGGVVPLTNTTMVFGDLEVTTEAYKSAPLAWGNYVSDERTKKNIRPYLLGLETLEKLKPKWFYYNGLGGITATEKRYVGILAQELEEQIPSMVKPYQGQLHPQDQKLTELLSYQPNQFLFLIINAFKEVRTKMWEHLNARRSEIELLESRVAKIEGVNAELERALNSTRH